MATKTLIGLALVLIVTLNLQAVSAWAQAAAPAAASSTGGADSLGDIRAKLSDRVDRLVKAAVAGGPQDRLVAELSLLALQQISFDLLSPMAGDPDAEVAARTAAAVDEAGVREQMDFYKLGLGKPLRDELERLAKENPKLVSDLLSPDTSVRVKEICGLQDDKGQAQALLVINLRYGSNDAATAAAVVSARPPYRSQELLDALAAIVADGIVNPPYKDYAWESAANKGELLAYPPKRRVAAMKALIAIHDPRTAPVLTAMILRAAREGGSFSVIRGLSEALVATGQKAAVPVLMQKLQPFAATTMPTTSQAVENDQSAAIVFTLMGFATQDVGAYRLNVKVGYAPLVYKDEMDRQADIARLKEWWAAHKDTDEYRNLKPFALPELDDLVASRMGAPAAAGAAAGAPSAVKTDLPKDDDLRAALAAKVGELVQQLRNGRTNRREAAQQALAGLGAACLDCICSHLDDPGAMPALAPVIEHAAAQAQLAALCVHLDKDQRAQLTAFAQANQAIVQEIFSPNYNRMLAGMKKLCESKPPQDCAEPVVYFCLRHPSRDKELITLTAQAAGNCRCHSERVVDALDEIAHQPVAWYQLSFPNPVNRQRPYPEAAAILALGAIGDAKATAKLVDLIKAPNQFDNQPVSLAIDGLLKSGDKRSIPALMEGLANTKQAGGGATPVRGGGMTTTVTYAPCDECIFTLVKLTGQDVNDYKIKVEKIGDTQFGEIDTYGFTPGPDRDAAISKFRQWWDKNMDSEPYKNLQPQTPAPTTAPANP
jgi:hypothetical protein